MKRPKSKPWPIAVLVNFHLLSSRNRRKVVLEMNRQTRRGLKALGLLALLLVVALLSGCTAPGTYAPPPPMWYGHYYGYSSCRPTSPPCVAAPRSVGSYRR